MIEQLKQEQVFTLEECAKWCGITRNAMYMHYRRGHIRPVPMLCHRLYFSREELENFRSNYKAFA